MYMCLCFACLDWKNHGSEYYECSRYKENPNVVNEGAQAQAREALKKYLFYFERVSEFVWTLIDSRKLTRNSNACFMSWCNLV